MDSAEASEQHIRKLPQVEPVDPDLADLRDHDETLAGDLELVGQLDVSRQDEGELVGRAEAVVGVKRGWNWPVARSKSSHPEGRRAGVAVGPGVAVRRASGGDSAGKVGCH